MTEVEQDQAAYDIAEASFRNKVASVQDGERLLYRTLNEELARKTAPITRWQEEERRQVIVEKQTRSAGIEREYDEAVRKARGGRDAMMHRMTEELEAKREQIRTEAKRKMSEVESWWKEQVDSIKITSAGKLSTAKEEHEKVVSPILAKWKAREELAKKAKAEKQDEATA